MYNEKQYHLSKLQGFIMPYTNNNIINNSNTLLAHIPSYEGEVSDSLTHIVQSGNDSPQQSSVWDSP